MTRVIRAPARRPAGRRPGSSRSRCSGTGCRPAPRARCRRPADGSRASRSCTATSSPGVQKPHCTAPVSRKAVCTGCSSSSVASPSTVTTSRPCAWPAATRQAHTTSAVEVDRARPALALLAGVLGPGQPEPLTQDVEQALALPHVVGLPPLAVDRQVHPHRLGRLSLVVVPGPAEGAPGQHRQRVPPVGRRAAHVVDRRRVRSDQVAEPGRGGVRQVAPRLPQPVLVQRRRPGRPPPWARAAGSARPTRWRRRPYAGHRAAPARTTSPR